MQLNYYRVKDFTKKIGIGACGSWYVELGAVAKCDSTAAPYCISNEVVCSDIGRFLRLPLPPSGILHTPHRPEKYWFTCLDFTLSGNAPPPVDAQKCARELADLSTGLIFFDILIGNSDRHHQNLAVDFTGTDPQMNVFDHSHALMGVVPNGASQTLQAKITNPLIANHCLIGHLDTDRFFGNWIGRIASIPDFLIEETAQTITTFNATQIEATALSDFLKNRRTNIRDIINANRASFSSIPQWSLI